LGRGPAWAGGGNFSFGKSVAAGTDQDSREGDEKGVKSESAQLPLNPLGGHRKHKSETIGGSRPGKCRGQKKVTAVLGTGGDGPGLGVKKIRGREMERTA